MKQTNQKISAWKNQQDFKFNGKKNEEHINENEIFFVTCYLLFYFHFYSTFGEH